MKKNIIIALLFSATFLIGAFTGFWGKDAIIEIIKSSEKIEDNRSTEENRDRRERRMREYFINELDLEEHQREAFFTTMIKHRRAMSDIMRESREKANAQIRVQSDSMHVEISRQLTQEQLEKWETMREQYNSERRGGNGRGPGPRG
jgi:membrane-associated HD superfamily phosphohydrolase